MYYGVLEEIYELSYINDNSIIIFKCEWFNTHPGKKRVQQHKNRMSIFVKDLWYENEPFILASQEKQVFFMWMLCSMGHTRELLSTLDIDIYGIFQK